MTGRDYNPKRYYQKSGDLDERIRLTQQNLNLKGEISDLKKEIAQLKENNTMTDKEQVMREHIEDLLLERAETFKKLHQLEKELADMTADRDKWKKEHKLLAVDQRMHRRDYDTYIKHHDLG